VATVIDSLIVTLGLDPKDFTKGQRETAAALVKTREHSQKTAKEMEAHGKQAAQFFSQIKNQVIGLTAAILGTRSVTSFVSQITQADAATGRLASNLGMSVRDLSVWQRVLERFGGTAGEMDGTFRKLNDTFGQIRMTGIIPEPMLKGLLIAGMDIKDFLDDTKPLQEKLFMLSKMFRLLKPTDRIPLANMLGITENTMNMLAQGEFALKGMIADQIEMNSLSDEDVEMAKLRQKAWLDLTNQFEAAGRAITTYVTPALIEAFNYMQELAKQALPTYEKVRSWATDKIEEGVSFADRVMSKKDNTPTMAAAWGNLKNLGNEIKKELGFMDAPAPSAPTHWTKGRSAGGLIRGQGAANAAPDATPQQPATGPVTSSVSRATSDKIEAYLNAAQTHKDGIIEKLQDLKKMVIPKDQENFERIMRQELGLNAVNAARGDSGGRTEVNIGTIQVNAPQATNAVEIARNIGPAIKQYTLSSQANGGLR